MIFIIPCTSVYVGESVCGCTSSYLSTCLTLVYSRDITSNSIRRGWIVRRGTADDDVA